MSRIGKKILKLPEKTELKVEANLVSVKGPLGELARMVHPLIEVNVTGDEVTFRPREESNQSRALWGTYASHISNMVLGVNKAFEKRLILEGIGFKCEVAPGQLTLALGLSHPVVVPIPDNLQVTTERNNITVSGLDKEVVGQFAARLRSLKKPEPYKGKGMRYSDEVIRRKQGKKST